MLVSRVTHTTYAFLALSIATVGNRAFTDELPGRSAIFTSVACFSDGSSPGSDGSRVRMATPTAFEPFEPGMPIAWMTVPLCWSTTTGPSLSTGYSTVGPVYVRPSLDHAAAWQHPTSASA